MKQETETEAPSPGLNQLRVLLVEDSELDAELVTHELIRHNLEFTTRRVWREPDLVNALGEFSPNIILSDYSMPGMDGLRSLQIAHEIASDIPFIFVSGTIGEERAIEALKNGATDYVLKTNLSRLGPAVRRAMREAADREARHALEMARQQLATILEATPDFVCICDVDMTMKYVNAGGQEVLDLPVLPKIGLRADAVPAAIQTRGAAGADYECDSACHEVRHMAGRDRVDEYAWTAHSGLAGAYCTSESGWNDRVSVDHCARRARPQGIRIADTLPRQLRCLDRFAQSQSLAGSHRASHSS